MIASCLIVSPCELIQEVRTELLLSPDQTIRQESLDSSIHRIIVEAQCFPRGLAFINLLLIMLNNRQPNLVNLIVQRLDSIFRHFKAFTGSSERNITDIDIDDQIVIATQPLYIQTFKVINWIDNVTHLNLNSTIRSPSLISVDHTKIRLINEIHRILNRFNVFGNIDAVKDWHRLEKGEEVDASLLKLIDVLCINRNGYTDTCWLRRWFFVNLCDCSDLSFINVCFVNLLSSTVIGSNSE